MWACCECRCWLLLNSLEYIVAKHWGVLLNMWKSQYVAITSAWSPIFIKRAWGMTGTLIHWLSFRNWRPSTTLSYKTNVIADSSACGLWPRTRSGLGHGGYKLNLANIVDRSPICSKNQLSSKFSDFAMALRMTSVMRLNSMVYLSKISLQFFFYTDQFDL